MEANRNEDIPFEKVRAWFFDLDGTLMDTDDQVVERLSKKLRFIGKTLARKLARRITMAIETPLNGWITFLDMLGLDNLFFRISNLAGIGKSKSFMLVPGSEEILRMLHGKYRLAVVSTRPEGDSRAFLEQFDLSSYFDLVVHRNSTGRLKPHPAPIHFAARELGLMPDECVMVGDTTVDMFAAKKAGAWAVGVLCGWGTEKELRKAGADLILPSTEDILELIQGNSDR